MTDAQRVICIENIYKTLKDVVDIHFPVYGSIYFADTRLTSTTHSLDHDFVIGPYCGRIYWECGDVKFYDHHSQPNHGPCTFPQPTSIASSPQTQVKSKYQTDITK